MFELVSKTFSCPKQLLLHHEVTTLDAGHLSVFWKSYRKFTFTEDGYDLKWKLVGFTKYILCFLQKDTIEVAMSITRRGEVVKRTERIFRMLEMVDNESKIGREDFQRRVRNTISGDENSLFSWWRRLKVKNYYFLLLSSWPEFAVPFHVLC